MALTAYQFHVSDRNGKLQPGATVEVRNALNGALASIYSDRNGSTVKSNPFAADANAFAKFFVAAGEYNINVRGGGATYDYENVTIPLVPSQSRELLTAARTYYVRTDGNDNNSGLENNAAGAFLTIQKAIDIASSFDLANFDVTVNVADGTYANAILLKPTTGSGTISIVGNIATPANVVLSVTNSNLVTGYSECRYSFTGVEFRTTTSGNAIYVYNGTKVSLGVVRFGAMTTSGIHVHAIGQGTSVTMSSNYTIASGCAAHVYAENGAYITLTPGITVTISGTPAFSTAFAVSTRFSAVLAFSVTFSGAATGVRYIVSRLGLIDVNGAGASYLPGDSSGSSSSGGQYV